MDISRQFEIFTRINTQAYESMRNELLDQPKELTNVIKTNASSTQWPDRIHAGILNGWSQHRDMYLSILKELDAVDVEMESKTVVGISRIWDAYALRAKEKYGSAVLPLAWEVILKFESSWPDWKVITFFYMIGAVPDVQSIDPMVWVLERTDSSLIRQIAGKTLAKLPKEEVTGQMQQLSEKSVHILQVIDNTLYEMGE